jgi:hypothetical protein
MPARSSRIAAECRKTCMVTDFCITVGTDAAGQPSMLRLVEAAHLHQPHGYTKYTDLLLHIHDAPDFVEAPAFCRCRNTRAPAAGHPRRRLKLTVLGLPGIHTLAPWHMHLGEAGASIAP